LPFEAQEKDRILAEAGISRVVNAASFDEHPEEMFWQPLDASLSMPAEEVSRIQLHAVRKRFEELREHLPALRNLAAEQGITQIATLNDAAALLFKHSVYKSYPVSLIEKNRYDRLTQWLSNLTTVDLSNVQTSGVESIDDWLDAVNRDAGVRIIHTTGTSGKLSFLPRGPAEASRQLRSGRLSQQAIGQPEPTGLDQVPTIVLGNRIMYNGYGAMVEALLHDLYQGDDAMIVAMNPGRLSADVLSLAGRLAAAGNRGELGRSQVSPAILNRLDDFVAAQKEGPARRARFFDEIFDRLAGKRVMMSGNWSMYHEMAEAGGQRGVGGIFAPDSLFLCAGGTKGATLPDGYRETIPAFLGISMLNELYGMSEMTALMPKCSEGKYHALPWMLLFLLDPETGQPAPRSGTHTGRFGVIDLSIETRWGGIVSGDEVTMTFGRCACGLDGPFLDSDIRRYSEKEGGDDKITCAGAPQAHDNALAFLAEMD